MKPDEFRALVLHAAIQGKLVPQDPNDVPAFVLIERMREERNRLIAEGKMKKPKNDTFIVRRDNHYYENTNGKEICIDDEIPFEIPDNWTWCRMKCVSTINPKNKLEDDTIVSFVPMANLSGGYENRIVPDTIRWGQGKKGYAHFMNGDVLLAKIIPSFQNLKSIVPTNLLNGYGCGTTEFHILRPDNRIILADYLLWFVKCPLFIYGGLSTIKGTVGQQRVGTSFVENCLVPIPPINEQKRIISKIINNVRLATHHENICGITNLFIERYKKSIISNAIAGTLVKQDLNEQPTIIQSNTIIRRDNSYYEVINGKERCIDDDIPFEIPNNWTWARGCICFKKMEGRKPTGESFRYIDISSVDNKNCVIASTRILDSRNPPSRAQRAIHKGDVLFSTVRPYLRNIALVDEQHEDCIASSGFYVCTPNSFLLSEYVYWMMISDYVCEGLTLFMKGDNSPSINNDDLEHFLYPIPPLNEQSRIVSKINELYAIIDKIDEL